MLTEREEILLMKLHDGEVGLLEKIWLRLTIFRKKESQLYLQELKQIGSVAKYGATSAIWEESSKTKEITKSQGDTIEELWNKIDTRILENGIRLKDDSSINREQDWLNPNSFDRIYPSNTNASSNEQHKWYNTQWFERIGWGATGAFITASLMILAPQTGLNPTQQRIQQNSVASTEQGIFQSSQPVIELNSLSPVPVKNASFGSDPSTSFGDRRVSGGQTDNSWFKSSGRMRLIQDTKTGSTLIWINRRRLGNYRLRGAEGSVEQPSSEFRDPVILPNPNYTTHE